MEKTKFLRLISITKLKKRLWYKWILVLFRIINKFLEKKYFPFIIILVQYKNIAIDNNFHKLNLSIKKPYRLNIKNIISSSVNNTDIESIFLDNIK